MGTLTYDLLWLQVDSLTSVGLPKSALEIVGQIYERAIKEKNDPQRIKAILFRIKLKSDFEENALVSSIYEVKREAEQSTAPSRQILSSILGQLYEMYYQQNRYRFRERSKTSTSAGDSLPEWDLSRLAMEIRRAYMLSLNDLPLLQSISIKDFSVILNTPAQPDPNPRGGKRMNPEEVDPSEIILTCPACRPTLYDFLAWRALDYFTGEQDLPTVSVESFKLDRDFFFYQARPFAMAKLFIPLDSTSLESYAIHILRNLASFHLMDKDPAALIDEELFRFEFVWKKGVVENKDSLYLTALKFLEKTYVGQPVSTDITYAIAQFLSEKGASYNPEANPGNKWDLRDAVAYCDSAIRRFPESAGARNCSILKDQITQPSFQLINEKAVLPNKPSLCLAEVKNIQKLYFRICKADPETTLGENAPEENDARLERLLKLPLVTSWSQTIPNEGDYLQHRAELKIPALPEGFYLLFSSTGQNFEPGKSIITCNVFFSTRISYVSSSQKNGDEAFFIMDRESGKPIRNVSVEAFLNRYNYTSRSYNKVKIGTYRTDANGLVTIPASATEKSYNSLYLKITMGKDVFITRDYGIYMKPQISEKPIQRTSFFTDRAIYRPGQTIYFKGIITEQTGDDNVLQPGISTTVTFYDVNQRKISEKSFTTNEFGSFNGSFVAPGGVLLGQMKIANGSGAINIQVEEYKRPTFEVTFTPVKGNYTLEEKMTIDGKALAYAGNALDGANVTYRITRMARFPFWGRWWMPYPATSVTEIGSGTITTADDGTFRIPFEAKADKTIDPATEPVFTFTIEATVTDLNGESQSAETSVSVGYKSMLLGTNLPKEVNPQQDTLFSIYTENLNGEPTPATVHLTLQKLSSPNHAYRNRAWANPDLFVMDRETFEKEFPLDIYKNEDNPSTWKVERVVREWELNTAVDTLVRLRVQGSGLEMGSYALVLKAADPFGKPVERTMWFTVYDPSSKELPIAGFNWFVPLKTKGEPGENAAFLIGSSEKDVKVLFEVHRKDSLISRKWLDLSNEQKRIQVPITEEDRGNFDVTFLFIKQNRVYKNSVTVDVPYTNKKLDISFQTFRDKLTPGQKEEWKIRISDYQKRGAKAEFLASMYDASLDAITPQSWDFSIWHRNSNSGNNWDAFSGFITTGAMVSSYPPVVSFIPQLKSYEELNWFGYNTYWGRGYGKRGTYVGMQMSPMLDKAMESTTSEVPPPPPPPPPGTSIGEADSKSQRQNASSEAKQLSGEKPPVVIRRDFKETAFFYPGILTDSLGNLDLSFTIPESLTKWKFMGLAHTQSLEIGEVEKVLITQKELMVVPNYPRFVRQGDTVVFSVKVVNMSNRALTGEVALDVPLPFAPPLITGGGAGVGYFTLPLGQSASFSWTLAIPTDPSLSTLAFKVVATAGNFSDGEEKWIPVLTNRMLVTESMPLPVRGSGTFDFSFGKLLKSKEATSLKNYNLTLEFASNPAWYAIQALPIMDEPRYESADNLFYAFYANSIASHIANSNPAIKRVFESWKNITPDALLSNLEKNPDLKSALLAETPWVMEAKSESERKLRLGLLFDLNTLSGKLNQNLEKLQKLQKPNGGWSWFEGMTENRNITQTIVTGLGHLHHLGIKNIEADRATWNMVKKAILFLDNEMLRDYEYIQKHYPKELDKNHLGSTQIHYLYARSYFNDIPLPASRIQPAIDYFRKQAEKYWLMQDTYLQGMIALALNRLGNKEIPKAILRSLSEKALHSNEMGMYWAMDAGYYWYQAPVETQALLIEAYDEILSDLKSVEEMKIWLLKQKQTQEWKTSRATAEACYALLLRGSDLLAVEPKVTISLGKETIDPSKLEGTKTEAGTGYFQVSKSGKEIQPDMGKVRITKDADGVAWGALYWQYFEDLDKITPASTPLKIEKKLFVERNTKQGPTLFEITNYELRITTDTTRHLTVGDKLKVRLILTVDRDLEYVHLKDMRASAFEPILAAGLGMSGYAYQDGLGYYRSVTDAAANFFFDYLPKGTWVFEYPLVVNAAGDYSNGISTVQCLYAPEFSAHSEGIRIQVAK